MLLVMRRVMRQPAVKISAQMPLHQQSHQLQQLLLLR
jgi:hypothetical protein